MRESPASKDMYTEAKESTVFGADSKQRLVHTADLEDLVRAIVNSKVCELARAL
jgi:hypothetical protein